jgi:hypothetical protein
MKWLRFALLIWILPATSAYSDGTPIWGDQIIVSNDGRFVFHLAPSGAPIEPGGYGPRASYGAFYILNTDSGVHVRLWSRHVPNRVAPSTILISDAGDYVVGIGDYGEKNSFRMIVFKGLVASVNECGKLVGDHDLKSAIDPRDLDRIVNNPRWNWRKKARIEGGSLIIQISESRDPADPDYRKVIIDLESGNGSR